MYGMRTSREHFSIPGSNPVATSVDVHALAETARRIGGVGRGPAPVIAELVTGDWQLVYFAEADRLREITRAQGRKYEGVRRSAAVVLDRARCSPGDGNRRTAP